MNEESIDRLVSFTETKSLIGVQSDTTMYKMIREGEFPEPIRRGRNNFYLQSEIEKYIKSLAASRHTRMKGC